MFFKVTCMAFVQDSSNKREINCDERLKTLFDGREKVGFLEIGKLLSRHFAKTSWSCSGASRLHESHLWINTVPGAATSFDIVDDFSGVVSDCCGYLWLWSLDSVSNFAGLCVRCLRKWIVRYFCAITFNPFYERLFWRSLHVRAALLRWIRHGSLLQKFGNRTTSDICYTLHGMCSVLNIGCLLTAVDEGVEDNFCKLKQ